MRNFIFDYAKKIMCFFLLLLVSLELEAKILIITHSFNRPDFIEIQAKTFQKFLKDDYEFVVFNDAPKEAMCQQINDTCAKLDISCVRIPQTVHTAPYLPREKNDDFQNPAVRCANVVQYSLDVLGFNHDGLVMIIDADMFLIKPFSIAEYFKDFQLAGVPQKREHINYIWNGLVIFNMNTIPDKSSINFNCKKVEGVAVDVGGGLHPYFKAHPELKFNPIGNEYINQWTELSSRQEKHEEVRLLYNMQPNNIEFLLNYSFLHYRSGGNWDKRSNEYHENKTKILNEFVDAILYSGKTHD